MGIKIYGIDYNTGTTKPWNHGTMEPRNYGTMELWNYRTMSRTRQIYSSKNIKMLMESWIQDHY